MLSLRDGKYLALGAIEPQFREALCEGLGFGPSVSHEDDRRGHRQARPATSGWRISPATDACVAPVLDLDEAPATSAQLGRGGPSSTSTASCSRRRRRAYSETDAAIRPMPPRREGADGEAILAELGYGADEIAGF